MEYLIDILESSGVVMPMQEVVSNIDRKVKEKLGEDCKYEILHSYTTYRILQNGSKVTHYLIKV